MAAAIEALRNLVGGSARNNGPAGSQQHRAFSDRQLPGIDLPIDFPGDEKTRFIHGVYLADCFGTEATRLTAREVAILNLVNEVTDKPNWHIKINDSKIVDKWREEAKAAPESLINDATFDWCLQELIDKAAQLQSLQAVTVFDRQYGVVKTETLLSEDLRTKFIAAAAKLYPEDEASKDWHPGSDGKVLNLVHPSMYPFVYGKTRVLPAGQHVPLDDPLSCAGQGEPAKAGQLVEEEKTADDPTSLGHGWQRAAFWSKRFQWLPCNVALEDGGKPRITSYINNLHPQRHQDLYGIVEEIIGKTLPLWDQCVVADSIEIQRITCLEVDYEPREGEDEEDEPDEDDSDYDEDEDYFKHGPVIHPDPKDYSDFKAKIEAAREKLIPIKDIVSVAERGLQVIVKLSGIELTPEKSDYSGGNWHLEGMLNEHIVATAIWYYDCENVTESRLSFQQASANLDEENLIYEQSDHWGIEQVYGLRRGGASDGDQAVQALGSVLTRQGRLVCFPNTLQHRVEPFSLEDKTKPGHRRFLVLWLVDPHFQVVSTADVAPQQHDWWAEWARPALSAKGLPAELVDQVVDEAKSSCDWQMGRDEAEALRRELMGERAVYTGKYEEAQPTYFLCEH